MILLVQFRFIDVKIDTFLRISKGFGATTVQQKCTKNGPQIPESHIGEASISRCRSSQR